MNRKAKKNKSKAEILLLIFILIAIMAYMLLIKSIPPKNMYVQGLSVTDKTISLTITDTSDSAIGYSGYKVRANDGKLFIQIRGSLIGFLSKPWPVTISIDKNKYGEIKEIYLQGNSPSDTVLISPK